MSGLRSSVGNCADNKREDVLYIKSLVFRIREDRPGGLNRAMRLAISETSPHCEPQLVEVLFNAQQQGGLGEKASGGRVMPGSKTLAMLQGLAAEGLNLRPSGGTISKVPKPFAEASAAVKLPSGKSAPAPSVPMIDLKVWIAQLAARRTPFKITGGSGIQIGIGPFGGGAGDMEITDTSTDRKKVFKVVSASAGVSVAPVSFSYSGADSPSGAVGNLYQGPLNNSKLTLDSFAGHFVALSGGVASSPHGFSVTIYFLGLGLLDLSLGLTGAEGVASKWDMLQKASGISITWGVSSSTSDAGVQAQAGKLHRAWKDINPLSPVL